ncbi:MAG: hypothetical protein ACP5QN_01465 [Minisyncoccia bacterium]
MKKAKYISKLILKISLERGRENEKKVFEALKMMTENGEILSFYKTNAYDDKFRGIDFFLFDLNGNKIPLQVKSSIRNQNIHKIKFPDVPVVIVHFYESTLSVIEKIKNILNQFAS